MADERFRILEDMHRLGRLELLPDTAGSPISLFKWLVARALAGEPLDAGLAEFDVFQQGFPLAERDFSNLRRHVCVAASALLLGRPVGSNAAEALALAHRAWSDGWDDLDTAIEACGAAICARDDAELALWRERARRKPSLDWVEMFEETLFMTEARAASISPQSLATGAARVIAEVVQYQSTVSPAPLVAALWRCVEGRASVGELLSGRARVVDDLVFGPTGEKPLLKLGKPSHEVVNTDHGPALLLGLKVTGRGPFSPGGYSIAPFTYELATLLDRIEVRLSRLAEPQRTQQMASFDAALARGDQAVTIRLQLARGVELSPEDAEAFRARIEHSWAHARCSMRDVRAEARVEVTR